jgi:hypothetical protein
VFGSGGEAEAGVLGRDRRNGMPDDLAFNHVQDVLTDKGRLVPIVYAQDRLDMAGTDVCVAELALYIGRMNIDDRKSALTA